MKMYKSYSFRNKDPVIDELRTIIDDEKARTSEIVKSSGVSYSTLYNWFKGKTKRPQSASIEAVGRSLGYKRTWQQMNGAFKKTPRDSKG